MSLAAYQSNEVLGEVAGTLKPDLNAPADVDPMATSANVIPLGALVPAEMTDPAATVNPYTDLARTALDQVLATGESPRRIRIGHILGAAFGLAEIPRDDRHLFYEAFNSQPEAEFLGRGWYLITRIADAETPCSELASTQVELDLEVLARQVVDQVKPGRPFEDKVFVGTARMLAGKLTRQQIADLLSFITADTRITPLEDGRFDRKEDEVLVTPRDPLAEQPELLSEVVVTRGTLDGMIKVALSKSSRRKPQSHRKHSGWRRIGDMDGISDV